MPSSFQLPLFINVSKLDLPSPPSCCFCRRSQGGAALPVSAGAPRAHGAVRSGAHGRNQGGSPRAPWSLTWGCRGSSPEAEVVTRPRWHCWHLSPRPGNENGTGTGGRLAPCRCLGFTPLFGGINLSGFSKLVFCWFFVWLVF